MPTIILTNAGSQREDIRMKSATPVLIHQTRLGQNRQQSELN